MNQQLAQKSIPRFESLLMPANFGSVVGEFVVGGIAKNCPGLVKNRYHNGHPDLIPANLFEGDKVRYAHEGIEVKASRYRRGWQGYNPERVWLMVFVFEIAHPVPRHRKSQIPALPTPFRFLTVVGAQLETSDWRFSEAIWKDVNEELLGPDGVA